MTQGESRPLRVALVTSSYNFIADGVALAAIQGLNDVVKDKDGKIAALEKRVADLEKLVGSLVPNRVDSLPSK